MPDGTVYRSLSQSWSQCIANTDHGLIEAEKKPRLPVVLRLRTRLGHIEYRSKEVRLVS